MLLVHGNFLGIVMRNNTRDFWRYFRLFWIHRTVYY